MLKININGKPYHINSLSELSFNQFNKIIVNGEVNSLQEYLSVFLNIDPKVILNSVIKSHTIEALHKFVFDLDVEKAIKNKRKAITFNDVSYYTNELSLDTFGKAYYFDLYFQRYRAKQINEYELSMYSLAICLCDDLDDVQIQSIYEQLADSKWNQYLPTAFFLLKKSKISRISLMLLLITYTLKLKVMRWKITTSKKRLIRLVRI